MEEEASGEGGDVVVGEEIRDGGGGWYGVVMGAPQCRHALCV
jgi:hypothetical protein